MSWNSNNSRTFNKEGNSMLSGQESIKNPQFLDLNSEKGMPKTVAKDSVTDVLSSKFSWAGVYSSVTGEEKSNSKQSSSGVESNCLDTALIDLKLGRFPDKKDDQFKDNPSFSSAQSSVPRKRARPGNSISQTPFCQVEGCNKDLSACKDYNKRHKVCEIHSKTAKVYVNGVEQRFCQQCSRFHSLSEFDDGKRSCRKRLAGHNERRRKNHASLHSSRRLIPPYSGTNFLESSYAASSYVCPNVLHRSHLHPPQKHEINNWNRNASTDHYTAAAAAASHGINNMNSSSSNKSSPFHDDVLIPMTRSKETDHYNNSLMTNLSSSDFDSLSLYQQNTPVEDLNVLDESSSFRGRIQQPSSSSNCALSLLSSSQSQTQYISSTIPTSHYSIVQISGNHPPTSADETNMESLLITHNLGSDKYGYNEFIPGSSGAGGDDSTIDLLELSSQLHNVENERQSMQMKQDDDPFFGLRIT